MAKRSACARSTQHQRHVAEPAGGARLLETSLSTIVIGIDGFTSETYEKYRPLGNRDLVYANVRYLREERQRHDHGPEIMVQFIEMDDNIGEFEQYRN